MVMPSLQNALQVVDNDGPDMVQFVRCKAMIRTQHDRGQPKLTHHALAAHVDMGGFLTIKAVEEKTIQAWNIGNSWHAIRLGKFKRKMES
jgi:hypothetical protein